MDIKYVLDSLNRGEIDVNEACEKIIENNNENKPKIKSSKLKITIIDKEEKKNIKIPAIPFWMITGLGNLGLKISSIAAKTSNDNTTKDLSILDNLDLKEIFDILRYHEPNNIVHIVNDKDKSEVKISIL